MILQGNFYVQDQLDPGWSIVLSTPLKDFLDKKGIDDLVDDILQCPFMSVLPKVESIDEMDDTDAIYLRNHCEGIWITNMTSI